MSTGIGTCHIGARRHAGIAALLFALLFISFTAHAQPVHAWEGTITIPTYELGPPDPNPPFALVNPHPVYPYPMLDDLSDQRAPKTYRAIYLENQYLKITILPELGGHVYSVYDKPHHREVLYRNSVIKYGLVGPRGAWIAGGMEFSFPFAHTTDTVSNVASALHQNADGSATAIVGAIDWVSNMYWQIALTLRPDTARLEEGVTLFNATPLNNLYLFWTNTAVPATDDLQYIYPMRETISDDPFAIAQSWPVWNGVDQSWYKNDRQRDGNLRSRCPSQLLRRLLPPVELRSRPRLRLSPGPRQKTMELGNRAKRQDLGPYPQRRRRPLQRNSKRPFRHSGLPRVHGAGSSRAVDRVLVSRLRSRRRLCRSHQPDGPQCHLHRHSQIAQAK